MKGWQEVVVVVIVEQNLGLELVEWPDPQLRSFARLQP